MGANFDPLPRLYLQNRARGSSDPPDPPLDPLLVVLIYLLFAFLGEGDNERLVPSLGQSPVSHILLHMFNRTYHGFSSCFHQLSRDVIHSCSLSLFELLGLLLPPLPVEWGSCWVGMITHPPNKTQWVLFY